MTYFEIFGIPVQLKIDSSTLPERYFELSRRFHPDYHIHLLPEEQASMLEKAAQINKAFKTFQDPDATIKYVLKLKGLLEEEEKYELPPDFLMEVMDINEQLMEMDSSGNETLGKTVMNLQQEIYEPVKEIVEHYQEGIHSEKELLQVKEYYYKKKYLDRIKEQMSRES